MRCEHPACTGHHGTGGSVAGKCPAMLERKRAKDRADVRRRYREDADFRERKKAYERGRYEDPEHRERTKDRIYAYKQTAAGMLAETRGLAKRRRIG